MIYRCSEEDKDAYLYYILSVHGQGRTIIFCTSIAALRHISSILRILGINALTNHAQMQQRARMKVICAFSYPIFSYLIFAMQYKLSSIFHICILHLSKVPNFMFIRVHAFLQSFVVQTKVTVLS